VRAVAVVAAAVVALGGCATPREPVVGPGREDWPQRRDFLQHLEDWRLEGRVAVRSGDDGYNGTLSWRQKDNDVDFRVRGPLGVGGFRVYGDRGRLRLETTEGDEYPVGDAEADMVREFGWSLPVHSVRYWIVGVSDPASAAEETVDDQGLLVELRQGGWAIHYDGYEAAGGMLLPRKIVMRNGDVRIRMVADRWVLALPDPDLT